MEILVIGDSWASAREAGTGRDAGWPELMSIPPTHRQAVSGSTAFQWAADHDRWLTRAQRTPADTVIVSLLGNDARTVALKGSVTADEYEAGLNAMRTVVDAVLRPLTIVMLYADPYAGRNDRARVAVAMLNEAIRQACKGRPVVFADTGAWLTDRHFDGTDIHPTKAGHWAIAQGMDELLQDHVRSVGGQHAAKPTFHADPLI